MKTLLASPQSELREKEDKRIWMQKNPFLIRLLNWEFWPAQIANIPVVVFWLYFAAKARHFFFFTAANPAIETGGLLGESKMNILDQVPPAYKPQTLFLEKNLNLHEIARLIETYNLIFPLILKPNVGERGNGVEKVENLEMLWQQFSTQNVDFLIQEYIDYQEEYSVLYYRFPGERQGHISSLCRKVYLTVIGDGRHTLRELIMDKPRALLQLPTLEVKFGEAIYRVPKAGEEVLLVSIGNHARGTMFLNANAEIDESLIRVFDDISHHLKGIYVGRFDLKTESLPSLKAGKNFSILEINGVAGEPAHIYDPNYPVRWAYRDLFNHWKMVYHVSKVVREGGVKYMGFHEAWQRLRDNLLYIRKLA
ncbi:MAG: hypothetical protein AAF135_24565 [Bacteroidota bacterium]